ncbi:MAG: EamA family transporter RarD [Treponema sp.]|jgi:chloramphenicol-sensitive protein RarD|nr:EamA family transporter RarD [Treponema sp.]
MEKQSLGKGLLFSVLAYLLWGVLPLYWKLLAAIPPLHILSFRILFSLILISAILFSQKNFSWLKILKNKKKGILLILAAFTISFNWGLYIWAVNTGHTIETSVGYYINPLISIVLGLCFFREKLNALQWVSVGLALAGVLLLTWFSGALPWIPLGLALSFGFYGLLKKAGELSAMESLGAETLIASPLGLLLLFLPLTAGGRGLSYFHQLPAATLLILLGCGVVTSLPLYLFGKGARLLPLSTLGFVQFVSPTLTFFEGVFLFRESFPIRNLIAFGFIWAAVVLYIASLRAASKKTS